MPWQIIILAPFDEDLESLRSSVNRARLLTGVREEFEDPFKGQRIHQLLSAGVATSAVDRVMTSRFPPTIRLQVLRDFRVMAWCYPSPSQAIVTHVFHKSSDPAYRRAVAVHDRRIEEYFTGLHGFFDKHRRK